MLGQHKHEEKKLRETGAKAMAEVLEARQSSYTVTRGNPQLVNNTSMVWKLKLRVTPDAGEVFTAEVKQGFPQLSSPMVGTMLPVLYDPGDLSKVVVDHDEGSEIEAGLATAKARVTERLAGDPERAAQIISRMETAIGDPKEMARQFKADPHAAIAASQQRVRDAGGGGAAFLGGLQAGISTDPVDRLAKLADLHDRGVLNDEQFEAQKQRILSE